jgi:hypothetical protein
MNQIKVASNRIPGILRVIDEISFHTSMLALNAAVQAASEAPAPSLWSAEAANETLALIEASIDRATPAASPAADGEALRGVAERLRRMRCVPAGIGQHAARVAVRQTRPFGDAR